jgi:hypothetical protein
MKKLLLIAALASLSNPAFASKARVTALGNADHLVDPQTAFDNPAHLTLMGDYVTFEAGPSNATTNVTPGTTTWADYSNGLYANPNAEGGFTRSAGDAKWGAYLGRKSPFTDAYRRAFGFKQQDNPIELQYAMKGAVGWGVALNYSTSDKKSSTAASQTDVAQKQTAAGIRLGAVADMWEAFAVVGLVSTAEGTIGTQVLRGDGNANGVIDLGDYATNAGDFTAVGADSTAKYKGTTGFKVGGAYKMENLHAYLKYYQDGFKYEGASTTFNNLEVTQSQADLGVIDHNKLDGGQWFYGAAVQMYTAKQAFTAAEVKTTATYLPFLVGVEYDAASWLTLRASAIQNVLLGSTKTEATGLSGDADTIANNTKVAAGLGLRLGKWAADGSWAAQTTGAVNTTNFLTNVGLTYMF